jgi:hypothetical protein
VGWGGALIAPICLALLSRLQHHCQRIPEDCQVIPNSWSVQSTPPADIPRQYTQPHLVPQPALFELVAPKKLAISHCNPKVSSVDRQQTHDLTASFLFNHTLNFQKSTFTYTNIRIRVHPYPHSQHRKFLKHNIYIIYGTGMQSEVVYSPHHDLTASFVFNHTLNFPKIYLHLHRY